MDYTMTWNNSGPSSGPNLSLLEQKVQQALLYAPRELRCTWQDCRYGNDPFGSLKALVQHIKRVHFPPQSVPPSSRRPCNFIRACRHSYSTSDELVAHVHKDHLNNLVSTCWLCSFQDSSFLSMVTHLQSRHSIEPKSLPLQVFLAPVPKVRYPIAFPLNPAFAKVPSYFVVTQYVKPYPLFRPENVAVPTAAEEGPYDFLENEERQVEIMRVDASLVKSKGKERAPVEIDILLSSRPWPASTVTDSGHIPFSASLTSPEARIEPINPFPYRSFGEPLPPKAPPPTLGNYFGMCSIELPRLLDKN